MSRVAGRAPTATVARVSGPAPDDPHDRAGQAIAAAVAATLDDAAATADPLFDGPAVRRARHVIAAIEAHRPSPDDRARPDAPPR